MPFADHGRLVARRTHAERKRLRLGRDASVERANAVRVAVLAGHDRRAARHADRIRAEHVVQPHSFAGQAVDVRRRIQRGQPAAVGTDRMRRVVIGHDEQDVRSEAQRIVRP